MDEKFLGEILKEIKDSQKEMQSDIGHIKEDLKVHIYRTNLLEESLNKHENENKENFEKVHSEIEPIQRHVNYVKGIGMFLGSLLTILTILSLLKLI